MSQPITRPVAEYAHLLVEEAATVWALSVEDVIREQYLRDDGGVVFMLECQNLDDAHRALRRLPLVANDLLNFSVWVLAPFTPWARLMKSDGGRPEA